MDIDVVEVELALVVAFVVAVVVVIEVVVEVVVVFVVRVGVMVAVGRDCDCGHVQIVVVRYRVDGSWLVVRCS